MIEKFTNILQFCFDVLFRWAESPQAKWAARLLLAILFISGLFHWGIFLDWTNNKFDIQDWHEHVGPYLDFLRESLHNNQFPMYADSPYMIPSEYLARQNRPLSPQILLLYFVDPATYVLINVWLFYALGFYGLLLIRARYKLSIASFLLIFLLFNLNGHIVAHIGAGHFEWVGYFLLPCYCFLILKLVEGEVTGWQWLFGISLVLLGISLQGAAHFFIYCIGFIFLLALFQPKFFPIIIKAIFLSILLSMVRILPPAMYFAKGTGLLSLGGFDSVLNLFQMMISESNRAYWEQTYYVGILGFVFILYYGVFQHWKENEAHQVLYLPSLVMVFFSIGSIYLVLFNSGIPFLDSQRAPTRFVIVPLVFLIILAGIQFQSMVNKWGHNIRYGVIFLFTMGLLGYDLISNSRVWSLTNYSDSARAADIIEVALANYSDPIYETTLLIGFSISIITLAFLIFFALREQRQIR